MPSPVADALRVLGFLLGFARRLRATYYALAQLFNAQTRPAHEHNVFYNSTWGVWAALAGFALRAAAGAGARPDRREDGS